MPDVVASKPVFKTPLRVRYAETDAAGVVYYANYLTYFEVARVELLRALGVPITEVEERGILMPVVAARVKYVRPARLDDLLDISLSVHGVGPASFTLDYEVRRRDVLLASGQTRQAVCERVTGRAMPMPAWLRDVFDHIPGAATEAQ